MRLAINFFFAFFILSVFFSGVESSRAWSMTPLSPVGEISEKLGSRLDLSLTFRDQDGKIQSLADMLKEKKALVLTLNYYRCTTMCTFQFAHLAEALKELGWSIGADFALSTISFDPLDTSKDAKEKQNLWRAATGQADAQWNFYTGEEKNIESLTRQLNFYYKKEGDEYGHTAALFFIRPDGTFYRYLYGMVYDPADIKSALIDTGNGKIGNFYQRLLEKLRKYDPESGRYANRLHL